MNDSSFAPGVRVRLVLAREVAAIVNPSGAATHVVCEPRPDDPRDRVRILPLRLPASAPRDAKPAESLIEPDRLEVV